MVATSVLEKRATASSGLKNPKEHYQSFHRRKNLKTHS
jgi:hypothetical protein